MNTPVGITINSTVEISWSGLGAAFAEADNYEQAAFLMSAAANLKAIPGIPDMQLLAIRQAIIETIWPDDLAILKDMLDTISEGITE